MHSVGTKHLIDTVEAVTGFKVIVDSIEGISEDAQMISARPEMPVHVIRVNKSKLQFGDYIVAIQCAMLLRLWSDPLRVPVFCPITEKINFFLDKLTRAKVLAQLGPAIRRQTAIQFVQGLMNQLRSMPLEILTIQDCNGECPDLRRMQAESVDAHMRVLSENFAPKLRDLSPELIWRSSVSMSAAYALNWSKLSGFSLGMLPYVSAGFGASAAQLLAEIEARPEKTSNAYTQIVDSWAHNLGLASLYKWETRNAFQ